MECLDSGIASGVGQTFIGYPLDKENLSQNNIITTKPKLNIIIYIKEYNFINQHIYCQEQIFKNEMYINAIILFVLVHYIRLCGLFFGVHLIN